MAVLLLSTIGTVVGTTTASAHTRSGVRVGNECATEVSVGSHLLCGFKVAQSLEGATATITAIVGRVIAVGGRVSSGNVLPRLKLKLSGGATCNATQTSCTVPYGGLIVSPRSSRFSVYTVPATDSGHVLSDEVTASYTEACMTAGPAGCGGRALTARARSSAVVEGITFLKSCESPTLIGTPYQCAYQATNPSTDTATVTSIVDDVQSAGGPVVSGNLLPLLTLTLAGGATCNVSQTSCTIPDGGSLTSVEYSFYSPQPADVDLPGHLLTDVATVTFTMVCVEATHHCPGGPDTAQAGSSTVVKLPPGPAVTRVG
jgi:hypothetical protein